MSQSQTVSRTEWREARKALMVKEKALNKARDALAQERRALPRVKVVTPYVFDGINGKQALADLFQGRSQLIIYHFMYGADWDEGCPSCSFWADNYDRIIVHLNARDISMATVSNAPLANLLAYQKRMGWSFDWLSSLGSDFNYDFEVSFHEDNRGEDAPNYNFGTQRFNGPEAPGVSVFQQDADGTVYHTYSTFARGLDMLNGAYHLMDLTPKGRDEGDLPYTMAWLRRNDSYAG